MIHKWKLLSDPIQWWIYIPYGETGQSKQFLLQRATKSASELKKEHW